MCSQQRGGVHSLFILDRYTSADGRTYGCTQEYLRSIGVSGEVVSDLRAQLLE